MCCCDGHVAHRIYKAIALGSHKRDCPASKARAVLHNTRRLKERLIPQLVREMLVYWLYARTQGFRQFEHKWLVIGHKSNYKRKYNFIFLER